MAVIQYSGLVSQVRGKIQGTVFSKGHAGFTAYKKGTPRQLKTSEQLRVMQGMSTNGHTWNELDSADKSVWNDIAIANPVPNRIGDTVTLSAYHYYRLITSKVWPLGNTVALIPDPMAGAAQEVTFQVDALVFEQIDSGTLVVQLDISGETINNVSGDMFAVVWISNPVATINSKYWGTFYRVATVQVTGAAGASEPISLALSNEVLPTGFRTFEGAFHVVKLQYIRPESGAVGVEQIASAAGTLGPIDPFAEFFPLDPPQYVNYYTLGQYIAIYWYCEDYESKFATNAIQTQIAPPQSTIPVPTSLGWSANYQTLFNWWGDPNSFFVDPPVGYNDWGDLAYQLYPSAFPDLSIIYMPIRSRISSYDGTVVGNWVYSWITLETSY